MNPVIKICGEWKAVRDLARKNGCDEQVSRQLLMELRNAFKNVAKKYNTEVDVLVAKPREIDINGAHINNKIGQEENIDFDKLCEISSKDPNTEVLGSIIATTKDKICKGIRVPISENKLETNKKAAELLARNDFSIANNKAGYIHFVNKA
ncbi:MAG: hypothetical protein MJ180_05575 [Candidatus Gastranaerophilales bacterium]|nr:hypothetical protein [Candidatus Gastranaerophilales bacterium]